MFNLNESIRYYLYPFPTDMRKSFYTLSGIVQDLMHRDVRDGEAFVFINRNLDSLKILHMETGGLVIYHMKLEAGHFRLPSLEPEANQASHKTSWQDLMLMVQGINPSKIKRSKRWNPT